MDALAQREEPCAASHPIERNDLLDLRTVCQLIGGTKPIHPATLYRGVAAGRYPAPIKVGPNASRWLRSECEAALQSMIARRAGQ